jgi:hypothetical protein
MRHVTYKEYREAECRVRESIHVRRDGYPHTYPMHERDLETMRIYHEQTGEIPNYNRFYDWLRSVVDLATLAKAVEKGGGVTPNG